MKEKDLEWLYELHMESQRRYKNCKPPKLSVDKMGWQAFLQQWNDEVLYWVKKTTLMFGADPVNNYTETQWQEHLIENNVPLEPFMDLKKGGIDYPPKTPAEKTLVDDTLQLHRQYIEQIMTAFYKKYNQVFGKDVLDFFDSDDEALYRNSILFPPAKPQEILAKEKQLDIRFPKTYKGFLSVSNGLVTDSVRIAPVSKLEPFFNNDYVSSVYWEVFLYHPENPNFKAGDKLPDKLFQEFGESAEVYEFERQSVLFSDNYDDFYLLFNPQAKADDGDWLGWQEITRDGGMEININKARSFKAQMEYLYQDDIAQKCALYKWYEASSKAKK